ncbi:hypothetical protein L7F22_044375 [Adiantum nelumboides]|nr:hypothetical protein [Adiantum nelumboides]
MLTFCVKRLETLNIVRLCKFKASQERKNTKQQALENLCTPKYNKVFCIALLDDTGLLNIQVFSSLEVVNVNSVGLKYLCGVCKSAKVSRQSSNPHCFACNKVFEIWKVLALQAKLVPRDDKGISVTLHGKIVDRALRLPSSFCTCMKLI